MKSIRHNIFLSLALLLFICQGCGIFDSEPDRLYQLVFVDREGHHYNIWTINEDGSDRNFVAEGNIPVWSPDGLRIAYRPYGQASGMVYTTAPDGSNQKELMSGAPRIWSIQWSPDGNKLALGTEGGIFVVNADGSGHKQITENRDIDPSWSPDGSMIVFTSYLPQQDELARSKRVISIIDADGNNLQTLTEPEDQAYQPVWLPDSNKIAIIKGFWGPSGNSHLYVYDSDSNESANLTADEELNITHIIPAPSGQSLSFIHYVTLYVHDIYTINTDSRQILRLNPDNFSLDGCGSAHWSPENERIVIGCGYHTLSTESGPVDYGIHIMDKDGGNLQFVTTGRNPLWSPVPL